MIKGSKFIIRDNLKNKGVFMSKQKNNRNSFTGTIGFVLAAAGSAVGLGNIWRFPYLAAKDGGGLFLVIYIILALTFGFTLLTAEIAIGRKTKQSPLTAYTVLKKGWKPLGVLSCLVPMIILPYYVAIGGWVLKYCLTFTTGKGAEAAEDGYFTGFITSQYEPIILMAIFLLVVALVIILGVNKGIESSSKILMPILLVLVIGIAVYAMTISYTDGEVTRTGLEGLKIYTIPNLSDITFSKVFVTILDAMGQLFFSLSVAMGILIAYGSYVPDDSNLPKSINQIEFFDTLVAFLAGAMIVPSVYVFMGKDGLDSQGVGLMFISLPKVFVSMGKVGNFIGILFFVMVLFAALTSAISIMEAVVSSLMDQFGWSRLKATIIETIIALVVGGIVCLGYNLLYFEVSFSTIQNGQILDILDYLSNNILMPVVSIATCILIGWVLKPKTVIDEVEKSGCKMGRKGLFIVMIKYVAPIMLFILLLKSIGVLKI